MRIVLLCFLFAGGLGLTCGAAHADNALTTARAGVLDLREWNWASDGPVALNGSWEFYWNWLGDPGGAPTPPLYVSVPGLWTEADRGENDPWPQHGFGSYRLRILLPPNSGDTYARRLALRFPGVGVNYELEVDGRLIARRGVVSANPALARNELYPAFVEIDREDFGGQLDLVLRTSNYYHGWASGPGAPLVFGPARLLSEERENAARLDVFLFGAILIMGLYHIALFAVRPRDVSPLYFGGFCLAVTLRLLVTGERILPAALADVFPVGAAFSFFTRVEYLSVYAAAPLFLLFARTLFPAYFASYLVRAIAAICLGLGLTTIVATPLWFATYTMPPFQGLLLLGGLMIFVAVGRAALHGREGSALFLIGFSLLFLSVLHDILGSRKFIHSEFLLPAGLFGFILAQAAMLAIRFAGAFRHVEDLTGELAARNKDLETAIDGKARQARSFERFVPGAFLEMLNRSSVMDVAAGDASLRDMSVMFCDIRSFTTLSEGLGPERSFEFLNQYLGRMVPVIEAHSGFVDKFHGDAIMALFRDGVDAPREAEENRGRELSSGDRALGAALEMFSKLRRFNREREILGVA
ncbi:MAG: adenylate/guanylate cyclase domain-containing protein, partial [Leptospirales bacterium]